MASQTEPDYDTVHIVGTGAEEGAWLPVIAGINETLLAPGHSPLAPDDRDLANWVLAQHVHRRRTFHSPEFKVLSSKPGGRDHLEKLDANDRELKAAISRHLVAAVKAKSLRLRERFMETALESRWERTMFLTTNWDHALFLFLADEQMRKIGSAKDTPLFPIHGACWPDGILAQDVPLPILLPSEAQIDHHHDDVARQFFKKSRGTTWQMIDKCKRLCLYGLSLDPLDAELAALISTGLSTANCEIWILNLKEEEARLRGRIERLLTRPLKIHFEATNA